jgi:carbon monoxide dehydrogenase subunit G
MLLVALALPAPQARAGEGDVALEVTESSGVYHVRGSFTGEAPLATAWAVLSDYERIGAFVKSIKTSEFVIGPGGERVLRQDAVVRLFPFRRAMRVELAIAEWPERRIEFRDVLGRDFKHYVGAWTLHAGEEGSAVEYTLEADPTAGLLPLIGRSAMSGNVRDLLTQVRAEMKRRAEGEEREDRD